MDRSAPVEEAARPIASDSMPAPGDWLERSLAAARRYLLGLQAPDGHWCGELEGDTILESEYLLAMHFIGRLHEPRIRKAGEYIRRKQVAGGGWSIYPGGPTDVSASVKAYFALKLLGDSPEAEHMARARAAVLERGGLDACNSFTKIYLAIFGQYDWDRCPTVPPELVLFPRRFVLNIYHMSAWSRAILVPLSIISALRPSCAVPEGRGIGELVADTYKPPRPTAWSAFFYALDAVVRGVQRLPQSGLREVALDRAERWTLERLEDSDGLGAIFPPIVNTIFALHARGYALDHPTIRKQVEVLERLTIEEPDTLRVQPCFSPVWDTAYAVNALLESGSRRDSEEVVRATRWLLERRADHRGDWSRRRRSVERTGWYFEYANPFYPDCDTTAQVLSTISRVVLPDAAERARCQQALYEGLEWHLGMQNSDGGWAAFDRGCEREILTRVPFADHNAMIDPSTADLTARGIEAMAEIGFGTEYRPLRRAVAFLKEQQEADGSWYGRWGCNYVYGTYLGLWGLMKAGEAPASEAMRRGAAWLVSCQNRDGGWGESPASYDDPSQKGRGPSTPSQTAWALIGLIAAGQRDGPAARRGVEFLLDRQAPDGSWPEEEWTGTGFPRVFYLRYHLYPIYFPILALGLYARKGSARRAHAGPARAALSRIPAVLEATR